MAENFIYLLDNTHTELIVLENETYDTLVKRCRFAKYESATPMFSKAESAGPKLCRKKTEGGFSKGSALLDK